MLQAFRLASPTFCTFLFVKLRRNRHTLTRLRSTFPDSENRRFRNTPSCGRKAVFFLRKSCDSFKWIETIPNVEHWICVRLNIFLSFEKSLILSFAWKVNIFDEFGQVWLNLSLSSVYLLQLLFKNMSCDVSESTLSIIISCNKLYIFNSWN